MYHEPLNVPNGLVIAGVIARIIALIGFLAINLFSPSPAQPSGTAADMRENEAPRYPASNGPATQATDGQNMIVAGIASPMNGGPLFIDVRVSTRYGAFSLASVRLEGPTRAETRSAWELLTGAPPLVATIAALNRALVCMKGVLP